MNSLDDLELELRKLPGVKAAGFDESAEMLLVQLHLGDQVDTAGAPGADQRVAHRGPPHRRAHRGRDRALARDSRRRRAGSAAAPVATAGARRRRPRPRPSPRSPRRRAEPAPVAERGGRR